MVMEKRSVFIKIVSVIMALVMSLSFVLPVFAATSKTVNVNTSRCQTVNITTGKGWMYSLGLKTTTVTVTNTGKGTATLYKNIGNVGYSWEGSLAPGQTKTYKAKGSGKKYSVMLQKDSGRNTTVKVSVSAGSVY